MQCGTRNELSHWFFRGNLCVLMKQVNLGIIGGGTVGSGVYLHLQRNGALLASRLGVRVNLVKVAVKAYEEPQRKVEIPILLDAELAGRRQRSRSAYRCRTCGGTTIAREMILTALEAGQTGHYRQQSAALRSWRGTVPGGAAIGGQSLL